MINHLYRHKSIMKVTNSAYAQNEQCKDALDGIVGVTNKIRENFS